MITESTATTIAVCAGLVVVYALIAVIAWRRAGERARPVAALALPGIAIFVLLLILQGQTNGRIDDTRTELVTKVEAVRKELVTKVDAVRTEVLEAVGKSRDEVLHEVRELRELLAPLRRDRGR